MMNMVLSTTLGFMFGYGLISFLIGAAVGSVITWLAMRKRVEK